jgi:hypothetical protein
VSWHKCVRPPCEGWYLTKIPPAYKDTNAYRWWDGELWSWAAFPHENAANAAKWAEKKEPTYVSSLVMWRAA